MHQSKRELLTYKDRFSIEINIIDTQVLKSESCKNASGRSAHQFFIVDTL